jgi:hypothetical protein
VSTETSTTIEGISAAVTGEKRVVSGGATAIRATTAASGSSSCASSVPMQPRSSPSPRRRSDERGALPQSGARTSGRAKASAAR